MPDLLAEITAAARAYYVQANALPLTAIDFSSWLDELPATRRADLLARGLAASWAEPWFLRYCLEAGATPCASSWPCACQWPPTSYGPPTVNSTATCRRTVSPGRPRGPGAIKQ